jgi:4-hydroxybenzoate polyprenyltransferase
MKKLKKTILPLSNTDWTKQHESFFMLFCPMSSYARLMRIDKPIGILLLWFPVVFALWIANHGKPPLQLVLYFLFGTIVMRSAGCVVNDLADRHVDKHVSRTAQRPLTTGEVSVSKAILLFAMLLFIAFFIVIQLPLHCFYYALVGLSVTILYPFCKRFIQAPQLVLSLAFSVSIPMAYTASAVDLNSDTLLLLMINMLWVIAYDTMYAMVDREDDLRLGVKSTAVLFGAHDRWIIAMLQTVMHGLWLPIAYKLHVSEAFYLGWTAGALVLIYQQYLITGRDPKDCFKAFQWSAAYGFVMCVGWVEALGRSPT